MDNIIIVGLNQNNLKNISLVIPKRKIVVFTGVSGSGKSSIVFDTIAAEAKRSLNETFPSFVRSKLPKYLKPKCDLIANLSPAIIVDQDGIGANMRSTVGTFTEISAGLRVLFSRLGEPYVGPASAFSFNDQRGMCKVCSGLGKVTDINIDKIIDKNKAISNGAFIENTLKMGSWYWSQLMKSTIFDIHKPIKDYTEEEYRLLLFGTDDGETNLKNGGIYNLYKRKFLTPETIYDEERANQIVMQKPCPACLGKKLNRMALACWINGFNIDDLCNLELVDLKKELLKITDVKVSELVKSIINMLDRMLEMGLGYLNLARLTNTLSNGEAQRLKLVKYLGSSLSDMLYIFDEPSTGMHPRDVYRMNNLLINLKEKGNSVIVVEHDQDVIRIADEVVDVGPLAGSRGGEIVFQGPYDDLLSSSTITGESLRNKLSIKKDVRISKQFLSIHNANLHNLKNISVNIPLNVITVITGVAGSGKSSLMKVFADRYHDQVIKIDQKPITATGRSTPASYLGFMDEIRKEFAKVSKVEEGLFSFNSMGACPECKGKGQIVIELAYMDPIITTCESCEGSRYSKEALSYLYKGKNILDVISLSVEEALNFFDNPKIIESLKALIEVGLSYLTLGQPTSTLSGGERQRL